MRQFYLIKEKYNKKYYIVQKSNKQNKNKYYIIGNILFCKQYCWEKYICEKADFFTKSCFYIKKRYKKLADILIDIPELTLI